MAGIHKTLVRIANREDPDQTASKVCTVFLGFFGGHLVFEILKHLLYAYWKIVILGGYRTLVQAPLLKLCILKDFSFWFDIFNFDWSII